MCSSLNRSNASTSLRPCRCWSPCLPCPSTVSTWQTPPPPSMLPLLWGLPDLPRQFHTNPAWSSPVPTRPCIQHHLLHQTHPLLGAPHSPGLVLLGAWMNEWMSEQASEWAKTSSHGEVEGPLQLSLSSWRVYMKAHKPCCDSQTGILRTGNVM